MTLLLAEATTDEKILHTLKQLATTSTTTSVILSFLMLLLTLEALGVYAASLIPHRTAAIRVAMRKHPIGSFMLGTVNIFFLFVITFLLAQNKASEAASTIPGVALILLMIVGYFAKGIDVGARVLSASGIESRPPLALAVGQPIVLLLSSIPFIGWFIIGPYFAAAGFGGTVLSFFLPSPAGAQRPSAFKEAIPASGRKPGTPGMSSRGYTTD